MEYFPSTLIDDIAVRAGTPCYVYNRSRIEENYRRLASAFGSDARHCYSVKANGNLSILRILRDLGAGFDVVSGGEMQRALAAGANPASIVFAGVGKRDDELIAAIDAGVGQINVESTQELRVLSDIALAKGKTQPVALRINPNVDPHTHRYMATGKGTSKFGIEVIEAMRLVANRNEFPGVSVNGIHIHIGSMVSEMEPYVDAMQVGLDIIAECRGMGAAMTTFDMGGGFGVAYAMDEASAPVEAIANAIMPMAREANVTLQFEPGRSIIADAGILLARVLYTKNNGGIEYAIVDAAMNDLIRPALYGAKHGVSKIENDGLRIEKAQAERVYSIVGPVCESGDKLAEGVTLPTLTRGDLLAIHHAGAYAISMASNYNTRPRAAEVLIEGECSGDELSWRIIRARETPESLWAAEVQCLQ